MVIKYECGDRGDNGDRGDRSDRGDRCDKENGDKGDKGPAHGIIHTNTSTSLTRKPLGEFKLTIIGE